MADRTPEILRESLKLFLEKGFHGASTREICRRAGISSGLFFHYFPTKEAVYEHLVGIGVEALILDREAALADPLGYLTGAVEHLIGMLRGDAKSAAMFVFMNQVQRTPGISATVDEQLAAHDIIVNSVPVIEEGQRRGQLRSGDPLALSTALWGAVQGLAEELAIHPGYPVPEAGWYLDMVRAPGGAS